MHRCAAGCGRYFSGITPFDKHLGRDYENYPHIWCKDPESVGLRPHKTWTGPNGETVWSTGKTPKNLPDKN